MDPDLKIGTAVSGRPTVTAWFILCRPIIRTATGASPTAGDTTRWRYVEVKEDGEAFA